MSVPIGIRAELREALLKSATEARGTDYSKRTYFLLGPDNYGLGVLLLLEEGKMAEAVLALFLLHKEDFHAWYNVRSCLIRRATCHRQLSMTNTIIECSSKGSLAESTREVPGL